MSEKSTFSNLTISEEQLVKDPPDNKNNAKRSRVGVLVLLIAIAVLCVIIGVAVHFGTKANMKCDEDQKSKGGDSGMQKPGETKPPEITTTSEPPPMTTLDPSDLRLPTDLKPLHYNVLLRPDIYQSDPKDFRSTGKVEAYLQVQAETKTITLHAKTLVIQNEQVKVRDKMTMEEIEVDIENIRYIEYPREFLEIPVKEILQMNKTYIVTVPFSGPIKKDLKGIYYSDYINEQGDTVYLLTSQMQPTDARKTFPCMDEPALKATFNVTVERKSNLMSKSNTEVYDTETLNDGWIADHYETTPLMSTYLLAFLVSDFECVSNHTSTGNLVEICARPTAMAQTAFAMSIAVDMQEWFEWYYNVSYPLSKMTHVAVPDFAAGAMENWGLIIYRETALLFQEGSSASAKERVAEVVSHELAHQWFGNLVTPYWWDDIWLNEGFASYMQLLGVHNVKDFDTWNMEQQFVVSSLQYVFVHDSLASSHPIYQPISNAAEIYSIFDTITYYKGASVIRMMKYFLGEQTFRWGISHYLQNRLYKAADHKDLFEFLSEQSYADGTMLDVQTIMNTWIKQMGYPVVTFDFNSQDNTIKLSQTHFLMNRNETVTTPSDYNYKWIVPISYMTDVSGIPDLEALDIKWLNNTEGGLIDNVDPGAKWVIGNVAQTFFYRCNYNQENWNALVNVLQTNHLSLPTNSRSQILDDSFMLGRSGYIDQLIGMNATLYMHKEEEYHPLYVMTGNMGYVRRMLYQSEAAELLKKYMQQKLQNIYNKLGWEMKPDDNHRDGFHRARTLSGACVYELPDCISTAINIYHEWMNATARNESYSIDGNVVPTVLCYAIKHGGLKEWDFAHKMLVTENSGKMRQNLLRSLGCSKEPWILQRYLQYALAEDQYGIRQQDMRDALISVAGNTVGIHIAWNFFKANWDIFFERFGETSFAFTSMVSGLTTNLSAEWELEDLLSFMAAHPNKGTAARQFIQSVESIKANIKWRMENEDSIVAWLRMNQSA